MDKQEFLLLIPAIIYGVAIVDLLKVFKHKSLYWELVFWGTLLMTTIISLWMDLYQKLEFIVDSNLNFFVIIIQSIIYAQTASVLTPEDVHVDGKKYFLENKKTFFLLIAATSLINIIVQFVVFDDDRTWLRLIAIPLFVACAYFDKLWYRTALGAFLVVLAIDRLFL